MRLILASASPRRVDLLAQIGVTPDLIRPVDIDETPLPGEAVRTYVERMAREKARAICAEEGDLVLAADTTVAVGRRILGKPESRDEAQEFLRLLSGRRHRVLTAVVLLADGREMRRLAEAVIRFRPLSPPEIEAYLDSGEWQDKAGGYGIQGRAGGFIPWIRGSHSAVIGLPLSETATLLAAAGYKVN